MQSQKRSDVPDFPVPDGAAEGVYQISVPRFSRTTPTRRLVRLCRWQSVQLQFLQVAIQQQVQAVQHLSPVAALYATHVYIDVFGEAMEALTPKEGMESLTEVAEMALNLFRDGYDALR